MASERAVKLPYYQVVDGIRFLGAVDPSIIRSGLSYKARDDDIFVVTYPKCGTTWTQAMVYLILHGGKPAQDVLEFWKATPFLEFSGKEAADSLIRPNAIKTHLPVEVQPWNPKAKYIIMIRNPKDACISLFHHCRTIPGYDYYDGEFNSFFELWINGKVEYNDYFDFVLGWWAKRNCDNVLILAYENAIQDKVKVVRQISEFLGQQYVDMLDNDVKLMDDILKYSSVEHMKVQINDSLRELFSKPIEELPPELVPHASIWSTANRADKNIHFVRKGQVNDWKSLMSAEQSRRLEAKFREQTAGSDIGSCLWNDMSWLG